MRCVWTMDDPIVEEIRAIRREISKEAGYDLDRLFGILKEKEQIHHHPKCQPHHHHHPRSRLCCQVCEKEKMRQKPPPPAFFPLPDPNYIKKIQSQRLVIS